MPAPDFTTNDFRAELTKLMPGYSWIAHRPRTHIPALSGTLEATGTQSSGSNRLSTLSVERTDRRGSVTYKVMSAGYGLNAKWLHSHTDATLASALRGLQDHYEAQASTFQSHANALVRGRGEQSVQYARILAAQQQAEAGHAALQILEAIRATHPELIADNAPEGFGMNKLRAALHRDAQPAKNQPVDKSAQAQQVASAGDLITVDLNVFDETGVVCDGTTAELTRDQVSDIVDHASQLVLLRREGMSIESTLDELDEAMGAAGVVDLPSPDAAGTPTLALDGHTDGDTVAVERQRP